jgi:hypothetical protein
MEPTLTEKPKGLYAKLAHVMGQVERLPKTGHNAHFNYDFVTDADVSDTIRPMLAALGVAVLIKAEKPIQQDDKTLLPVTIKLVDSETGDHEESTWFGEANDRQDKGVNKAATAAVKYWLLKTFLFSTGDPREDADNGPVQGMPEWLRDPEVVTNLYWWLFHEKGLTKEQVVEVLGCHPLQWTQDRRSLLAIVENLAQ